MYDDDFKMDDSVGMDFSQMMGGTMTSKQTIHVVLPPSPGGPPGEPLTITVEAKQDGPNGEVRIEAEGMPSCWEEYNAVIEVIKNIV